MPKYVMKSWMLGIAFFGTLSGTFVNAVTLNDSDYERKSYTVEGSSTTQSCSNRIFEIIEPLPKGFHSVLPYADFGSGNNIKILVVKKKGIPENFAFNILCVSKWQDGTTVYTPVAKISLP